jgi:hypothetical protein
MGVGVMAGALIIGPKERAAIAEVIARAATRVTPLDQMKLAHAFRERTGAAFNPLNEDLTIVVPLGWHITYTHEEQPGAVCRHMSVSVEGGRGPGPQGVAYLMHEFGFKNLFGKAFMYSDNVPGCLIIHVVEPLDGDMEKLRKKDNA